MAKLAYIADDGRPFDTPEEADAHSASIATTRRVNAYIVATGLTKGAAAMLRNHLLQWVEFNENGVMPPKVEVKKRGPKKKVAPAET